MQSFYVQTGYLLTGETRSNMGIVKPLRPFNLARGEFGLGAWELTSRYSMLDIGTDVFTNGLADANNWANRVNIVDFGFNWYLNQYLKFMFNWEHAEFNQPVLYNAGKRQLTSDLFVARIRSSESSFSSERFLTHDARQPGHGNLLPAGQRRLADAGRTGPPPDRARRRCAVDPPDYGDPVDRPETSAAVRAINLPFYKELTCRSPRSAASTARSTLPPRRDPHRHRGDSSA